MGEWFDRDGKPMTMMEWARRFEDLDYRRVADTYLDNGLRVSTVWLGLNHNWGAGPPLIFESMVFGDGFEDLDCERYSTEAEAIAGHESLLAKWRVQVRT